MVYVFCIDGLQLGPGWSILPLPRTKCGWFSYIQPRSQAILLQNWPIQLYLIWLPWLVLSWRYFPFVECDGGSEIIARYGNCRGEREREREKECEFSGKENTLSLNVELSFTN